MIEKDRRKTCAQIIHNHFLVGALDLSPSTTGSDGILEVTEIQIGCNTNIP